jgi:hypothetical protein
MMNDYTCRRCDMGRPPINRVSDTGAQSGSVLLGLASQNEGLRLRILQDQPRGAAGAIKGPFEILNVGNNKHAVSLRELLGQITDAKEVITVLRRSYHACVSVVDVDMLVVEEDS